MVAGPVHTRLREVETPESIFAPSHTRLRSPLPSAGSAVRFGLSDSKRPPMSSKVSGGIRAAFTFTSIAFSRSGVDADGVTDTVGVESVAVGVQAVSAIAHTAITNLISLVPPGTLRLNEPGGASRRSGSSTATG